MSDYYSGSRCLKLWKDAYDLSHQMLCTYDHVVQYERTQRVQEAELGDLNLHANVWGPWEKVEEPYRTGKSWFVRDMSFDDLVTGNTEDESP